MFLYRDYTTAAGGVQQGFIGPLYKICIFGIVQQVFGPVFNAKAGQRWRTTTLKKVP
jgi:hypothetical protein